MFIRNLLLILFSLFLLNCSNYRFGVKAGVNYSDFNNGETEGESNYVVGISSERKTSEYLTVGLDILTSKRSVILKNQKTVNDFLQDFRIALQFFEFTWLIKYHLCEYKNILILPYLGPSLSICGDSSEKLRSEYIEDLPPGHADIEYLDSGYFAGLNGDLGFNVGINVKYEPVYIDFRYYHGVVELGNAARMTGFNQKWRTFEVMLGYVF